MCNAPFYFEFKKKKHEENSWSEEKGQFHWKKIPKLLLDIYVYPVDSL